MVYALAITIAAGVLLLLLLASGALLARRGTGQLPSVGRWRWHPSPLGLLLLLPLLGLLLFRLFPAVLFIPLVLPFLRWRRRFATRGAARNGDGGAIEGEYHRLDEH